jgi:serine/threonine protein kinase
MPAKFIKIGEPAHDPERQAIRYLVEGLPATYTVYGNPWLVERTGVIYEVDAIVVAPHALFVVEVKSYRGRIEGTDHDWYIPEPIPSPLKLNRLTAQVLKTQLKRENYLAGQVWVEGFVFLSATVEVGVKGPASKDRIHTRKTILPALQDPTLIERLSDRRTLSSTGVADKELLRLLTGAQKGPKPVRRVREYEITTTLSRHETYTELLGLNQLSKAERVLRIYSLPPLAAEEQRARIVERARWEAQVLGRLGRSEGILSADPPFTDEAGIVLPLEYFKGITLTSWIERYGPDAQGKERPKADLRARTNLWIKIAETLDEAHKQGVVHRLLRPEVILVEDRPEPEQIRVTGFDLAKQLSSSTTIGATTIGDDRLVSSAPEVIASFSSAEPASDQFSLGAILAILLTGRPLFENTRQILANRRMMRRVRDMSQRIPLTLDEAVERMVSLRPTERYPSLQEAIAVVRGREADTRELQGLDLGHKKVLDPDNLEQGDRLGADYEILSRLGQGGMAVVYAARHLVSGKTRAIKIARSENAAEDALQGEYKVLSNLDHPNVVRVIDLSKMVEGRLTLVMERVGGETLKQWLASHPKPELAVQRRLAEDLLAALEYLEQTAVTHKDLKPDNLLIDGEHLTVIDFSLADYAEDTLYGGTALYRDPASGRWTHGTDRYAGALCLFELYAGRHAFDGQVPEPGQAPLIQEDDISPSGLAAFFRKALDPSPELRFPSARAMRDALLLALGEDAPTALPPVQAAVFESATPLRTAGLSRRAIRALARCNVHTAGELLALPASQVQAIHAIGTKTLSEILGFQERLHAQGVISTPTTGVLADPPVVPDLTDSPEPVQKLPLLPALRSALEQAGLPTVGAVASLTHSALIQVPGIGRTRLAPVLEALHQFRDRSPEGAEGVHTLDRLWGLASRPLSEAQRIAVERVVGLTGLPETQSTIAEDLGKTQPQISLESTTGIEQLDRAVLAEAVTALDSLVDSFGGIARLDELGQRIEEEWAAGMVTGEGMARLLIRIGSGRVYATSIEEAAAPLVARPMYDRETLRSFSAEVLRLAGQWPPLEPESVRRSLSALLPQFGRDPVDLGVRICEGIQIAETGHIFIGPLDARQTLGFVLHQLREPVSFDALRDRVLRTFGPNTPYPESTYLLPILQELDCQIQGEKVWPGRTLSILPLAPLSSDVLPLTPGPDRNPEEVVRDMLRDAAASRGFRMLVAPPERHVEIGRSVATVLGGTWLSFEDEFFADHGADLFALERAERFTAQRGALTEAAESTFMRLLEEHGQPGRTLVLGDLALLGLCEALDLPRRFYDEALAGNRGFWVLVLPGVIHNRQPRFNEGPPMWHLEGATLPLLNPLSA